MKITLLYQVSCYIRVKEQKYKELGPAKLPCYKRVMFAWFTDQYFVINLIKGIQHEKKCPCETGLPLSVFQTVHKMSLVLHVLFKVLNYISSVSLSERKQCNSSLVSLWIQQYIHIGWHTFSIKISPYVWRVLLQNGLSAVFYIFKVRAPSYNTKLYLSDDIFLITVKPRYKEVGYNKTLL